MDHSLPSDTPVIETDNRSKMYVGDTCASRLDSKTGLVARTFEDLDSHALLLSAQYPDGVTCHSDIARGDYNGFLSSGQPPKGTVLVTWMDFAGVANFAFTELVPEASILALDRELLVGDVVKTSAQEAMTGTIQSSEVQTTLIQPRGWPAIGETDETRLPLARNGKIQDIPASELIDTLGFTADQIILYKGWVGKIIDHWEAIRVRLQDGAVVELEDSEMIEEPNDLGEGEPQVGDYITTKKSNLRRGQWIYGAYNANTPPSGYVTEVRVISIDMQWLHQRYNSGGVVSADPPRDVLERTELDSGDVHLVDTSRLPPSIGITHKLQRMHTIDVGLGDQVRFRDLSGAAVKYGDRLKRIPRTETLGFDINIFTVAALKTSVTVLWQDLRLTTHNSVDLIPASDFDIDGDVHPGELVITKAKAESSDEATYIPQRVGIAQAVDSRDRQANVRWFEGSVLFAADDHTVLLPGSRTGVLGSAVEEVSLYDISTANGLSRRLGDLVILAPTTEQTLQEGSAIVGPYRDLQEALSSPDSEIGWFGEIVELGLDGLLTIRLCAAPDTHFKDVHVPWECTTMAYGTDHDPLDSEDDTDSFESGSDGGELMDFDGNAPWRDEADKVVDEADQADWTTDDEDVDEQMNSDTPMVDVTDVRSSSPRVSGSDATEKFSYENMFQDTMQDVRLQIPESFAMLEGAVPADHYYARRTGQRGTNFLRRIQKEHKILRSSLPSGVFVRGWESSLDILRIMILGPLGTPYEYAPFVIDLYVGDGFPEEPPQAFFHSWTESSDNVNPNLYSDGKICLSLLGTWPGDDKNESWTAQSTILQVIVSLLGLVLVKEPYYNEAGFEVRAGTAAAKIPAAQYSEKAFLTSRLFIIRAVDRPVHGFEDIIHACYTDLARGSPQLLIRAMWDAIEVVHRSPSRPGVAGQSGGRTLEEDRSVSAGALTPLRRHLTALLDLLDQTQSHAALQLKCFLHNPGSKPAASIEDFIQMSSRDPG